jgi:hypothetical protein
VVEGAPRYASSVSELCEVLPAGVGAELLVPSSSVVTERLTLPPAPRDELLAMAQLQLEKLLPYNAEDFVFDIEELGVTEESATILAVTVALAELKAVGDPIRLGGFGPSAVGVNAVQVARSLAGEGEVLALWMEGGMAFLLVAAGGKLAWLESVGLENDLPSPAEITRARLGAELSGALSGPVGKVFVGSSEWRSVVREALPGMVVEELPSGVDGELAGNWLPSAWAAERMEISQKARFVERLQLVAMVYVAILALGFSWLAYQKAQLRKVTAQIAELQPQVELSKSRQTRWRSLEAAVDPSRYLVELLHQATKAVGGADIRITEFQLNPKEFAFAAEAANVDEAINYVRRLKTEPELGGYRIESPNPNILPNERAQFRVSGKVDSTVAQR